MFHPCNNGARWGFPSPPPDEPATSKIPCFALSCWVGSCSIARVVDVLCKVALHFSMHIKGCAPHHGEGGGVGLGGGAPHDPGPLQMREPLRSRCTLNMPNVNTALL